MADFNKNRFSSKNQSGSTPDVLFQRISAEFNFSRDVCADETNYKVNPYWTERDDALSKDWDGVCWMNPPFKQTKNWVKKAFEESKRNNELIVVCLVPAKTNTSWWHKYCMKGEVRFLEGRPRFEGYKHGLPLPLAIVIFGSGRSNQYLSLKL